jgi:hypothetical protein
MVLGSPVIGTGGERLAAERASEMGFAMMNSINNPIPLCPISHDGKFGGFST